MSRNATFYMTALNYNFIRSSLCDIGVVWLKEKKSPRIVRILLSDCTVDLRNKIKRAFPKANRRRENKVSSDVERYLKGRIFRFNLSLLEKGVCSKFQWDVSRQARRVPYGRVAAYKDLTHLVGVKSARAVGNALAKNPFPIMIPCHRIVGCDGKIGGFQAGRDMKKSLLGLEGIGFDKKGRIPKEFFFFKK